MSAVATSNIMLTASAAARIAAISEGGGLRLTVKGGGCSGFSYEFEIAPGPVEGDVIVERAGSRLFVDEASLPFLAGATLDWVDELAGSFFKVLNPNARSSCGCGVSFSI